MHACTHTRACMHDCIAVYGAVLRAVLCCDVLSHRALFCVVLFKSDVSWHVLVYYAVRYILNGYLTKQISHQSEQLQNKGQIKSKWCSLKIQFQIQIGGSKLVISLNKIQCFEFCRINFSDVLEMSV